MGGWVDKGEGGLVPVPDMKIQGSERAEGGTRGLFDEGRVFFFIRYKRRRVFS